jgi:hypothetical protein
VAHMAVWERVLSGTLREFGVPDSNPHGALRPRLETLNTQCEQKAPVPLVDRFLPRVAGISFRRQGQGGCHV